MEPTTLTTRPVDPDFVFKLRAKVFPTDETEAPYRFIQRMCKLFGIPAKGSKSELTAALDDVLRPGDSLTIAEAELPTLEWLEKELLTKAEPPIVVEVESTLPAQEEPPVVPTPKVDIPAGPALSEVISEVEGPPFPEGDKNIALDLTKVPAGWQRFAARRPQRELSRIREEIRKGFSVAQHVNGGWVVGTRAGLAATQGGAVAFFWEDVMSA